MSPTDWLTSNADILNNIAKSMEPVQKLVTGFAYVMGIGFAIKAFLALKQMGESRSAMSSGGHGLKEPLLFFLVAAVFIYFPTGLSVILETTFGESTITDYRPVDSQSGFLDIFGSGSAVGHSLALIIQTIGGIAFIRGWVLIARAGSQGQQPGGIGKGMVHVFGGILAMNIVSTLEIINNTVYGV